MEDPQSADQRTHDPTATGVAQKAHTVLTEVQTALTDAAQTVLPALDDQPRIGFQESGRITAALGCLRLLGSGVG